MQATVIIVVRINESLVGLACERQTLAVGGKSTTPLSKFNRPKISKHPMLWVESLMSYFWTVLTEVEHGQLRQWAALKALAFTEEQWQVERQQHLETLRDMPDPVYATELQACCEKLASSLQQSGKEHITWREFKQTEPSLSARYQRELLAISNGGKLSVDRLLNLPDESSFSIRYSIWKGAQRIFNTPQLVVEVENREALIKLHSGNNDQKKIARKITAAAGFQWHPGKTACVGWLRVHIDDTNKICFVDEVQSDAMEEAMNVDREVTGDYLATVKDWHLHGFATICHWAATIGFKAATHSRESAAESKFGMTPSDRKWNTYYGTLIKRFSLCETKIDGYPAPIWIQCND